MLAGLTTGGKTLSSQNKATVDQLYSLIANEEDARVCKDIPEDACREVPHNFFLILFSNVLTKLGDLLISPKTVLAWLMSAVGAPALVAWLVPIRESGSMRSEEHTSELQSRPHLVC